MAMVGLSCTVTWYLDTVFSCLFRTKKYLVRIVYAALLLPGNSTTNVCGW